MVEMSFSVTKTYLSLLAGVAFDEGLIGDVDEPVATTVGHDAFSGERHARITWRHLLQQTSDWRGTLWGLPWWADPQGNQGRGEPPCEPGTTWAYNDVRVNLLALALLRVFAAPLPEVLRETVMDRIGASTTWQWHGYEDAHAGVDGRRLESVSGGAHWGGGLWASAYDHARVGLLYLRGGRWHDDASSARHGWHRAGSHARRDPTTGCSGGATTSERCSPRPRRLVGARAGTSAASSCGSIPPGTSSWCPAGATGSTTSSRSCHPRSPPKRTQPSGSG
jgi:CubicO group peptidase (beta-lactamase class C family)